jgi:hypothetical protein
MNRKELGIVDHIISIQDPVVRESCIHFIWDRPGVSNTAKHALIQHCHAETTLRKAIKITDAREKMFSLMVIHAHACRQNDWWAIHRRDDIRELVEIARKRVRVKKNFPILAELFF